MTLTLCLIVAGYIALSSVWQTIALFAAFTIIGLLVLGGSIITANVSTMHWAADATYQIIIPLMITVILTTALKVATVLVCNWWGSRKE